VRIRSRMVRVFVFLAALFAWAPAFAQVTINSYTSAGSNTWNKPSPCNTVFVIAYGGGGQGGGGAGGAASSARQGGTGGGGVPWCPRCSGARMCPVA